MERTHCPYCAFQCGMRVGGSPARPVIAGDEEFPVNRGLLCVKGWNAGATLAHPERLTTPLIRGKPATWDEAIAHIAQRVRSIRERFGDDSVGVFGSGALTNEKAYLLGKFARIALRTRHIDYNGRFCMSSAAAAMNRAFGVDRGLPFPIEDIAGAEVVMLAGANIAETLPPLMQYFDAQRARGGRLIVVDPRRSKTTENALHLQLTPGTDAALANGILHVLVRDGLIDQRYIDARTEGFERVRATVAGYWPGRVERITGVSEAALTSAAHLLGRAKTAMILTGRGADQQSQGVDNTLAYLGIALALGMPGKRCAGFGALTGQGNGQGGREHGQKADQLPGYRSIRDPDARRHIASIWKVREDELPQQGLSACELLSSVRALFVFGSNLAVSAPDSSRVQDTLRALDLLVVADFFLSETAELAEVVLPAAQWLEEDGTTTNLEGRLILRRKVFPPPAGVRTDLEIISAIARALGDDRFDHASPREVFEELGRASRGGAADYSMMSHEGLERGETMFWPSPRLFEASFPTPSGRARFVAVAHRAPEETPDGDYPLYLTTGRVLEQYQSGTQTRRIAALRSVPEAEIHPEACRRFGLESGGTVELETRRGSARFVVKVSASIREDTIFVPFHFGREHSANRLTHAALDPTSKMPEFKVCAVRVVR